MQTLRVQEVVAPGYDDANTLFRHKSHAQGGDMCVGAFGWALRVHAKVTRVRNNAIAWGNVNVWTIRMRVEKETEKRRFCSLKRT